MIVADSFLAAGQDGDFPCMDGVPAPAGGGFVPDLAVRGVSAGPQRDDDGDERGPGGGSSVGLATRPKVQAKKPGLYKVLMLNDDYTPMEFVVHALEVFFQKNREEATRIMLQVHQSGVGLCGVYTYEVAETKVTQVMDFARLHQHPLQCTLERE